MNKVLLLVSALLVVGAAAFVFFSPRERAKGELDPFARCLAGKGITMYGADWCPHCQNEKRAFGDAFRLVPYVECPQDPQRCLSAGINGYPTWIFPGGRRFEGEQGLGKLSQESGCPLPEVK